MIYWAVAHADSVAYYKAEKATLLTTVGPIEVWRDHYYSYRLIWNKFGRFYISQDFRNPIRAVEEAKEVVKECLE